MAYVTNSGRVWRKVPESDSQTVGEMKRRRGERERGEGRDGEFRSQFGRDSVYIK